METPLNRRLELSVPGCSSGVKNKPAKQEMQETWVWSLGWEDPLEEEKTTHSNILAWENSTDRGQRFPESDLTEWLSMHMDTGRLGDWITGQLFHQSSLCIKKFPEKPKRRKFRELPNQSACLCHCARSQALGAQMKLCSGPYLLYCYLCIWLLIYTLYNKQWI